MKKRFMIKNGSIAAFFLALPETKNVDPRELRRGSFVDCLKEKIVIPEDCISKEYQCVSFEVIDRASLTDVDVFVWYEYDIEDYDDMSKVLVLKQKFAGNKPN